VRARAEDVHLFDVQDHLGVLPHPRLDPGVDPGDDAVLPGRKVEDDVGLEPLRGYRAFPRSRCSL
jgi:hypothetical protein